MDTPDLDGYTGTVAYIHNQVGSALGHLDAKASILSGMGAAGLVYLVRQPVVVMIKDVFFSKEAVAWSPSDMFYLAVCAIAAIMLVFSFLYALFCILPRSVGEGDSILYFRSIHRNWETPQSYADTILKLDQLAIAESVAKDTFNISTIAEKKYAAVAKSTNTFLIGAVLLLLTQILQILFITV